MLSYLNKNISNEFGIDTTYKIIPKSLHPYKLMTIYALDKNTNSSVFAAFICYIYNDTESLKKIFGILNVSYEFSPISVTLDFDKAQIKALKNCEKFDRKPYLIPCLFHYSQIIMRKLKKYKIYKKRLTKRASEIIHNCEILCFIKKENIGNFFNIIKNNLSNLKEEKLFIKYLEKNWIHKNKDLYNYSGLIEDILKCKNLFINKKGKENSDNILFSNIKSLNKVFFTNNICESMHGKIANHLPNRFISKERFIETLNYIINNNENKKKNLLEEIIFQEH